MIDLTEKWKNKELSHGAFYVRLFTGSFVVDVFDANSLRFVLYEDDIDEVLSPVPSFESWQDYLMKVNIMKMSHHGKVRENAKLKELLKECGKRMEDLIDWSGYKYDEAEELLTKINEALK